MIEYRYNGISDFNFFVSSLIMYFLRVLKHLIYSQHKFPVIRL